MIMFYILLLLIASTFGSSWDAYDNTPKGKIESTLFLFGQELYTDETLPSDARSSGLFELKILWDLAQNSGIISYASIGGNSYCSYNQRGGGGAYDLGTDTLIWRVISLDLACTVNAHSFKRRIEFNYFKNTNSVDEGYRHAIAIRED